MQSTPASEWSRKLTTTGSEWAGITETPGTPSPGTTANSSQRWTETTTRTQVKGLAFQKIAEDHLSLLEGNYYDCFCVFWLFSNFFRKLCALSEGRVVVQLLRTFKSERCVVQRRTLPQPLPRWSLLGRVQGRSLLTKESSHDDPSEPEHLPLGTHLGRCFPSHKTPHFHQIKSDHKIKPIISKT